MQLNEYQKLAMTTCTDSSWNFAYMFMNLVGEIGEFASKCAKFIRKGKARFRENNQFCQISVEEQEREGLRKELGDCLWQLSGLCTVMGWDLDDIAQENLNKLADRKKRNVIVGEGDNRQIVKMEEKNEYISVSEYAKRIGKSTQTVRNWIKQGKVKTMKWKRGKMIGILCKVESV